MAQNPAAYPALTGQEGWKEENEWVIKWKKKKMWTGDKRGELIFLLRFFEKRT